MLTKTLILNKEELHKIAHKYAAGSASQLEAQQLDYFMEQMQFKHADLDIKTSTQQRDRILRSVLKHKPVKTFTPKFYWSAAAIFVALVGLTLSALFFMPAKQITQLAAKGERKEVILEDGTHITLNGNSSITYSSDFVDQRDIKLSGEAFFDVARDEEHPFTIATGDLAVEVLGTSFNINSYDIQDITVSVNSGRVKVNSTKVDTTIYLTRNLQVNYLQSKTPTITEVNSDDMILWTQEIISLNKTTLTETARILENWYDVSITIQDEDIASETLTGKFKKEKLEHVLSSIALLKNLTIDYKNPKQISIRKKNTP